MKRSLLLSVLLMVVLAGCSPTLKVTMDYDKQANFAKYKTWSFTPETLNLQVNELNRRRILTAIETQLASKGMTKADQGDALVDVGLSAAERKEATTTNTGGGYGYGYRWGGGMSTTTVQTYVDGTLIISIVDPVKKELIWQGTGVKELNPDATAAQREQNLNDAVTAILKNYPPGANDKKKK